MLAAYQQMEKEGKIGPTQTDGSRKAYAEYPKWIVKPDGTRVVVSTQREELAMAAEPSSYIPPDPIVEERNNLALKVAELTTQLEALKAPAESDKGKAQDAKLNALGVKK